jgi:hypothetical protein
MPRSLYALWIRFSLAFISQWRWHDREVAFEDRLEERTGVVGWEIC